jgi:hypothetical protein
LIYAIERERNGKDPGVVFLLIDSGADVSNKVSQTIGTLGSASRRHIEELVRQRQKQY